jgi:hypothetical protein
VITAGGAQVVLRMANFKRNVSSGGVSGIIFPVTPSTILAGGVR